MAKKKQKKPETEAGLRTGLRFESILVNIEKGLRLELERARLETDHNLTVGEQAEAAVRAALRGYLPNGFSVGHGKVYDAYGDRSRQTDVIIANPDHPLSYPEEEKNGIYVVDGLSAAGEVKATMTIAELGDCIKKGAAFKELRMTINPDDVVMTARHQELIKQIGLVPPYFALAFDNDVAIDTMGKRLAKAGLISPPSGKSEGSEDYGHEPQPPLDIVCLLGRGVYLYFRPNNPMGWRLRDGPPGDFAGWGFMSTSAPLAWTLMWLHSSMPRIIRGGSVFRPYLMPNQKNARYMVDRGYIKVAQRQSASADQA